MRLARIGCHAGVVPLFLAALALVAASPAAAGGGGYPGAGGKGDFNGDGFADLAIGVSGEDSSAGAVNVIYGTANGLNSTGDQIFRQGGDLKDSPEPGDRFGAALAVGDINGDGFADLAVGTPGENGNSGAVNVIYGTSSGLDGPSAFEDQFRTQNSAGIQEAAEPGDQFGKALAAVKFGARTQAGVQRAALAIGAAGENIGGKSNAGAVNLIYSGAVGLKSTGNRLFRQGAGGIPSSPGNGDRFGIALQTANFGNGIPVDLAIGAPGDRVGQETAAGSVTLLYGKAGGPSATGSERWTQNSPGVGDPAEGEDWFGFSLAGGSFDADGQADLVVGVLLEDVNGVSDAGAVNLIHGHAGGLDGSGGQFLHQGTTGIPDAPEPGDSLGWAVAAADMGRSARSDLAIGVPSEDVVSFNNGVVHVLYGGRGGVTTSGDMRLVQGQGGVAGAIGAVDQFGWALGVRNFGRGSHSDLAIGALGSSVNGNSLAGDVNLLYGSSTGLLTSNDQLWSQDSPGIEDSPEPNDFFGASLAPPLSADVTVTP